MPIKRTRSIDLDNPSSPYSQRPKNTIVKTEVETTEENGENKFKPVEEERKRVSRSQKKIDKEKKNAAK